MNSTWPLLIWTQSGQPLYLTVSTVSAAAGLARTLPVVPPSATSVSTPTHPLTIPLPPPSPAGRQGSCPMVRCSAVQFLGSRAVPLSTRMPDEGGHPQGMPLQAAARVGAPLVGALPAHR